MAGLGVLDVAMIDRAVGASTCCDEARLMFVVRLFLRYVVVHQDNACKLVKLLVLWYRKGGGRGRRRGEGGGGASAGLSTRCNDPIVRRFHVTATVGK